MIFFYRSAGVKTGKSVVMIFFIEVPVISQEREDHDHSLSCLNTGTSIKKYHDHSLSWLNTGTSIKNSMTTHFPVLIQALL
jgi:hypothetical protein